MKCIGYIIFFTALTLSANIVNDIDKKFQMIEHENSRISREIEDISYDPFHIEKKDKIKYIEENGIKKVIKTNILNKNLNLSMILNKKAFINGKWYKENMRVADYVLKRINENSVILKKKNNITTLKLNSKKSIFFKRGIK